MTAGGRAANSSLHDAYTRLSIFCNSFHGNEVAALLHRCACAGVSAFVVVDVALNRCAEHQCICKCLRNTGAVDISEHICEHTPYRVCTCARVCSVCSLALGDEGGGVQLVYAGHLLLGVWGNF